MGMTMVHGIRNAVINTNGLCRRGEQAQSQPSLVDLDVRKGHCEWAVRLASFLGLAEGSIAQANDANELLKNCKTERCTVTN
jgi:hypothetical protein